MSVYRERRPRRPMLIWILILLVLALVAGLVWLGLQITRRSTPSGPSDASTQAALDQIAQGLDVFSIEYPKYVRGETSGATGALDRVQQTFTAARPALIAQDPAATARLEAAINLMAQGISAKISPDQMTPNIDDALAAIRTLKGQ